MMDSHYKEAECFYKWGILYSYKHYEEAQYAFYDTEEERNEAILNLKLHGEFEVFRPWEGPNKKKIRPRGFASFDCLESYLRKDVYE